MTKLCKPIMREVERTQRGSRPIIVALIPADESHGVPALLEFREKGRRARFVMPVAAAYIEAVRREVARRADERSKLKRRRRCTKRGLIGL